MKVQYYLFLWIICIFARCYECQQSLDSYELDTTESNATKSSVPQNIVGPPNSQHTPVYVGVVAAMVALVTCLVVMAGFCVYKRKSLVDATQRVLYRSSDSSILIRNEFRNGHGKSSENGLHNTARLAEKSDYPVYGVTGPNPFHNQQEGTNDAIDVNLTRNAQLFHYKQQKSKLKKIGSISSDASSSKYSGGESSHADNDEENSDGEYTVYECPGLASTTDGPIEIHNPLFDESTAYTNPAINGITKNESQYIKYPSKNGQLAQ